MTSPEEHYGALGQATGALLGQQAASPPRYLCHPNILVPNTTYTKFTNIPNILLTHLLQGILPLCHPNILIPNTKYTKFTNIPYILYHIPSKVCYRCANQIYSYQIYKYTKYAKYTLGPAHGISSKVLRRLLFQLNMLIAQTHLLQGTKYTHANQIYSCSSHKIYTHTKKNKYDQYILTPKIY